MTVPIDQMRRVGKIVGAWKRPLLITHTRADGDALGSLVAMRSILRSLGSDPLAVVFDPPPDKYALLVEDEPIRVWEGETGVGISDFGLGIKDSRNSMQSPIRNRVDGVLVLDTCSYSQLEPMADWLRQVREDDGRPVVVVVDHHVTRDQLAEHCLIDESAGATCMILYEWALTCGWHLDRQTVRALFVGIATDTGWFRFSNTNARTFEVAADLVHRGAVCEEIYGRLFLSESAARVRLFGAALDAMELLSDGRLAVLPLTKAMFDRTGTSPSDTEDLVNEALRIATVEVAVLLAESGGDPPGPIKVSFRSKGSVDVAVLAAVFGGGGHVRAAGARVAGSLASVKERVISELLKKGES